ncbi:PIG-L deacetylase family protein [Elusimicrobiota bacterium]
MKKRKILIVAAHPDDEILGCAGTVIRMASNNHEVVTLILGEGVTARDEQRDKDVRDPDIARLRRQAVTANKIIGINEVYFNEFPDNRFDTVSFLDIVKSIEEVKDKIKPDIVFTHNGKDLNVDHQITYRALITATRPMKSESVKEIYSFEIPSSTEWEYPLGFSPDVFFDISDTLDRKLEALSKYQSELRKYPHPRSLEGVKLIAKNWGMKVGTEYAEAFKAIRIIK